MSVPTGSSLDDLDSPQLLLDLDQVDANLARLQTACRERQVDLRVHFKSLKCGNLARYLSQRGVTRFLCAKLNEAEVLVDAGIREIFVANQIVGEQKLARLVRLAQRTHLSVCVDDADNVSALARAAQSANVVLDVLVEVDIGMSRCGVEPGEATLRLARQVALRPGLRFVGLQGYDGHLQLLADRADKEAKCRAGLDQLAATRRLLEDAGLPVAIVTGAGTGTWEIVSSYPEVTEIQPGSFLLMDQAYHAVQPQFGVALTVLATVVSRRPGWYVLDAGSKAVSRDFGTPAIKGRSDETVTRLSEEHTRVDHGSDGPRVGEHREIVPTHCCATMNLHRQVVAVRRGRVEAVWPIEASGRYD
jgi:D-serine deaminase-like pyridoxal phosphate-dependent protein